MELTPFQVYSFPLNETIMKLNYIYIRVNTLQCKKLIQRMEFSFFVSQTFNNGQ